MKYFTSSFLIKLFFKKSLKMKFPRVLLIALMTFLILTVIQYPTSSDEYRTYQIELITDLTDHKKPVRSVAFNSDGSLIVSGSDDKNARLWNAESGKQIKSLMKHPHPIVSVAFSPDSNIVASGAESGEITLWDVNYKERIRTLNGHEDSVQSLKFSSDGNILASASADRTIILWDMLSGKQDKMLGGHTGAVNSMSFSIDSGILASGSSDGTVKIWNVGSGENLLTLGKTGEEAVNSICLSPDGKTLAAGSENGSIKLWNLDSGEELRTLNGHRTAIGIGDCMAFAPDGRIMASGSADREIILWDAISGSIIDELKAHTAAVTSIAFSPDSKRMVSAGLDGVIKLWRIRSIETLGVNLETEYSGWQRGILQLKANVLGPTDMVKFQYFLDGSGWTDIAEKTEPPYEINWNTEASIPALSKSVRIRVIAERGSGTSAIDVSDESFMLDNEPPKTQHDYDEAWHKEDFDVNLSANDGDGAGLKAIRYRLNYGKEMDTRWNRQPKITDEGINTLEYWSVDGLGNEESHNILSTKLDKTGPVFFDWVKKPAVLPEGFAGSFRVSTRLSDGGGSGLDGKVPQFDYHIGPDTDYKGYENMSQGGDGNWYYDVPEPSEGWDYYRGKSIYYKLRCEDLAGNIGKSAEQQELVGSSKTPPTVKLTSAIRKWEGGVLKLEAEALDKDGLIEKVQFEYSLDNLAWRQISDDATFPYSAEWDTTAVISEIARTVWVRVKAVDNDGLPAQYVTPGFGVDNQRPTTSHDYDGAWHKNSFVVNLTADDRDGSGISIINYRLNKGTERDVSTYRQPEISSQGLNTLEYWSVDAAGNEEEHKVLSDLKLDRMPPAFEDWKIKREGSKLHVEVKITDADSGMGEAPQFDYHIGSDTSYSGYKEMLKIDDALWRYDVDISSYLPGVSGKTIYCKASAKDSIGNLGIGIWESKITGDGATTASITEEKTTEAKIDSEEGFDIKSIPSETGEPIPVEKKRESSIIWSIEKPGAAKVGEDVNIQGRLQPKMSKSLPLDITVLAPDDVVYKSRIDTDLDGTFEFTVPLTSGGEWRILANWEGNDEYETARSAVLAIRAIATEVPKPPSAAAQKAREAGSFLKKNTMIISVVLLYVVIIKLL